MRQRTAGGPGAVFARRAQELRRHDDRSLLPATLPWQFADRLSGRLAGHHAGGEFLAAACSANADLGRDSVCRIALCRKGPGAVLNSELNDAVTPGRPRSPHAPICAALRPPGAPLRYVWLPGHRLPADAPPLSSGRAATPG